ncbi:WD40 repeat domain-containing protein [Candidatus Dependentiae bacterium]|nr:WD40 repeat domain-containing protein [Candidatus Dependentiae bacterium]
MPSCITKIFFFVLLPALVTTLSTHSMEHSVSLKQNTLSRRFHAEIRYPILLSLQDTFHYNCEFHETLCCQLEAIGRTSSMEQRPAMKAAAFNPSGTALLTWSIDDKIRLWNIIEGTIIAELKNEKKPVHAVAFSPNERLVVTSGARDNRARVWNSHTGALLTELPKNHTRPIYSLVVTPQGNAVLGGSADKTVSLWELEKEELLLTLTGHEGRIESLALNKEGTCAFSGGGDKTVRLWDLRSKDVVTLESYTECVMSVSPSSDGETILTGFADGTAVLCDTNMRRSRVTFTGHEQALTAAIFVPGDKYVLTGSWDKTVRVWDIEGQELMKFDRHEGFSSSPCDQNDGITYGKNFLIALGLLTKKVDCHSMFVLSSNKF